MKATTKVLAVLWALVLAGLWLPQVTLAGYCPDSGNCCETDADCAGEGEQCLDPFGVCGTSGVLCDDDLDCGGHCAINVAVVCGSDADCAPFACNGSPKVPCVSDANCTAPATCEPNPCMADESCVMEPDASGRCQAVGGGGSLEPCAGDGDCPSEEYCVRPGACTGDGPCQAGLPTGNCSSGGFEDALCRADADCAYCSGAGDPAVWCDDDSDCRECSITQTACLTTADCLNKVCAAGPNYIGLYCFDDADCNGHPCVEQTCGDAVCVKDPICLMPHVPEGLCDNVGPACQDNGDCGGGSCVFSGSCTAGQCAGSKLPCATDLDCGSHCQTQVGITGCTTDADCGLECDESGEPCAEDADCGLACAMSGLPCATTDDCRTVCFNDGTNTGNACPDAQYCVDEGFCDDLETCECALFNEGEVCEPADTCIAPDTCVLDDACSINDGCTTAQKQACTSQLWKDCTSDADCEGCSLDGEPCAVDADCQDVCGVTGIDCAEDADCNNVCQGDPSVVCTSDLQCPGIGSCVKLDTCQANTCVGTCEPLFVCQNDETGSCKTQRCTSDIKCTNAFGEGWSCTGDPDCCTGTCGVLQDLEDPQCGDGDCESCYAPACLDNDNDGYGYPGGNAECPQGSAEDCNDDAYAVNPGATEGPYDSPTCSDTIDNNCDGKIDAADDGCTPPPPAPCAASASASTGPAGTGGGHSGWNLLLLTGVILIGASAKRVFGNKKE